MKNASKSFRQISKNNIQVDLALDNLIQSAVDASDIIERVDQTELEKTTQMFVFSSLILGHSDSQNDNS